MDALSTAIKDAFRAEECGSQENYQPTTPDRQTRASWPIKEKLKWVERIRIGYPKWEDAYEEIVDKIELGEPAGSSGGIFVVGESGVGKSTLLESIADCYPRYDIDDRTIVPCVLASVPSTPSIKAIAKKILSKMGDPLAEKGRPTNYDLTEAVKTLFKACGTRVLLLDELNNFIQKRGQDSALDLSNWLKEITDEAGVVIVVSGLHAAEVVIQGNEQLRRRFSSTHTLELVDDKEKPDLTVFRGVLKSVDDLLPLHEPSMLDEQELAWCFYYATDALIGVLIKLLSRAVRIAHRREASMLTREILAEAFRKEIGSRLGPSLNPFEKGFCGRRLNRPGEPFGQTEVTRAKGGRK